MVISRRPVSLLAAIAALLVAGCGSSSGSSSSSSSSSSSASSASTQTSSAASAGSSSTSKAATAVVTVAAHTSKSGAFLTDGHGRALYLWAADKGDSSTCYGACAGAWPPLTVSGKPTAGPGVQASKLGTTKRKDGSTQVTYAGHPLYYFTGDSGPGTEAGQGSDGFGAKWWIVSPSGKAITSGGSSGGSGGY